MIIGITQRQIKINDILHDCLDPNWYSLLSSHILIPIPNIVPQKEINIDILIISGGDQTPDREKVEDYYFNYAQERRIPIIGICHGAFYINQKFNGKNGIIDNHKNCRHIIDMLKSKYDVNSFHTMNIHKLGENLIELATCTHDQSIEAFRHENLPIWGIIWHPERENIPILPHEVRELLNA